MRGLRRKFGLILWIRARVVGKTKLSNARSKCTSEGGTSSVSSILVNQVHARRSDITHGQAMLRVSWRWMFRFHCIR